MKKLFYILLLILPALVYASGSGEGAESTDIIPRTINFLIFAAILYYFIANPIKDFFSGRKKSIADRLNSIQEKLKESNNQKVQAKELIEKAKIEAETIMETSKNETEILKAKILENHKMDIENLEKGFEDQTSIEQRKMRRTVISEILDEVFSEDSLLLKKDELLDIVMKKVA